MKFYQISQKFCQFFYGRIFIFDIFIARSKFFREIEVLIIQDEMKTTEKYTEAVRILSHLKKRNRHCILDKMMMIL